MLPCLFIQSRAFQSHSGWLGARYMYCCGRFLGSSPSPLTFWEEALLVSCSIVRTCLNWNERSKDTSRCSRTWHRDWIMDANPFISTRLSDKIFASIQQHEVVRDRLVTVFNQSAICLRQSLRSVPREQVGSGLVIMFARAHEAHPLLKRESSGSEIGQSKCARQLLCYRRSLDRRYERTLFNGKV